MTMKIFGTFGLKRLGAIALAAAILGAPVMMAHPALAQDASSASSVAASSAPAAAAPAAAPAAASNDAVVTYPKDAVNSGDDAWMLTSSVLVLMMTIPGLALFYAGMVRKKNILHRP